MSRQRSCDDHPKYVAGCVPCNDRSRLYEKRRAQALLHGERLSAPSKHVTQQVRELRALGYTLQQLAEHTGELHYKYLWALSEHPPRWVQLRTFHVIQKTYDELRYFPGPSKAAANRAAARGWTRPPPLPMPEDAPDDDEAVDQIAVERACKGERLELNRAEKVAVWDRMKRQGFPEYEIENLLGTRVARIERWRTGEVRPYRRRPA